jgi:fructose-specific phosphotransferase system IIC component
MSNDKPDYRAGMSVVAQSLGKGCLGGLGAALIFLLVGGAVYLVLSVIGLPENIVLFLAIAGGPIIGTVIVAAIVLWYARRALAESAEQHDETASSDTP